MLSWLRNKSRPLCQGLIVILLSSWASYVCLPCYAQEVDGERQHAPVNKIPCHPVKREVQHESGDSQKTTNPDCDCHLLVALNIPNPDNWTKAVTYPVFDLPLFVAYGTRTESWPELTYRYRINPIPERANSPPFYRYTVLLN